MAPLGQNTVFYCIFSAKYNEYFDISNWIDT